MVFGADKMAVFVEGQADLHDELTPETEFRGSSNFAGHGMATFGFRDESDFDEVGPAPPDPNDQYVPQSESFHVEDLHGSNELVSEMSDWDLQSLETAMRSRLGLSTQKIRK